MSQNYTPEFKKKLSRKKDEPTKASLPSMAYLKPASPSGATISAKNAGQIHKPKQMMTLCRRTPA